VEFPLLGELPEPRFNIQLCGGKVLDCLPQFLRICVLFIQAKLALPIKRSKTLSVGRVLLPLAESTHGIQQSRI